MTLALLAMLALAVLIGFPMAITHRITVQWQRGSDALAQSFEISSGAEFSLEEAFTAANDQLMAMVMDVSQMKALYISADQDCTLEFNSSSSPTFTLTIDADHPLSWTNGVGYSNPLTADITALYVSAAVAGTLNIRILYDPTV